MWPFLTREQHLRLAKLDVEVFKSRQRRGQVPSRFTEQDSYGYTPIDTLLLITAIELSRTFSIAPERASRIVERGGQWIRNNWKDIARPIEALESGIQPPDERFLAEIHLPASDPIVKCLTRDELCGKQWNEQLNEDSNPIAVLAISISRLASMLRTRAFYDKIELIDPLTEKSVWGD